MQPGSGVNYSVVMGAAEWDVVGLLGGDGSYWVGRGGNYSVVMVATEWDVVGITR